jgi:hypothetical protein
MDALGRFRNIDEQSTIFDLRFVNWYSRFNWRVGFSSLVMEPPVMPRANDITSFESPFTKRPPDVIANSRDYAEFSVDVCDRKFVLADVYLLQLFMH